MCLGESFPNLRHILNSVSLVTEKQMSSLSLVVPMFLRVPSCLSGFSIKTFLAIHDGLFAVQICNCRADSIIVMHIAQIAAMLKSNTDSKGSSANLDDAVFVNFLLPPRQSPAPATLALRLLQDSSIPAPAPVGLAVRALEPARVDAVVVAPPNGGAPLLLAAVLQAVLERGRVDGEHVDGPAAAVVVAPAQHQEALVRLVLEVVHRPVGVWAHDG